jgi:hypothetical protein
MAITMSTLKNQHYLIKDKYFEIILVDKIMEFWLELVLIRTNLENKQD